MKIDFRDMPLKRKIILIAVASASISLLAACLMFILNERLTFPRIMTTNLTNLAQILGDNSTAALSFNDNKTAQDILATLKSNSHIRAACLYDGKGNLIAQYHAGDGDSPVFPPAGREGIHFSGNSVNLYRYILSGKERVGTIYLESDMGEMKSRLLSYSLMTALVWVVSFFVSFLVATRLGKRVSEPLRQITHRMKDIARGEGDFSKRLEVLGKDEIGEVAEAFNTYVDKLQSLDEMKLDLISVVSHQLKTPVAEINGYIENMLEGVTGEVNAKQRRYLLDMKTIGQDNYTLISDLLSVSKIERGVVSVNLQPVSVKRIIELAIRDYEDSIHRKGLSLILEGLENDFKLYADQDKTVECMRNVVNNAIKCTDKGGISIKAGTQGDQGVIEIRDTGIGMSDEILKKLFTKSRVLGKEAGRAGAGLGLYIAKNFMKLQNGDIGVTSEMGKGTCFRLTLPRLTHSEGAAT